MEQKTYIIAGKEYVQQPLVLGQILDLVGLIDSLPANIPALGLMAWLPQALAILLIPKGADVRTRDIKAIQEDLYMCPIEVLLEVVEDFLLINPISGLGDKIQGLLSTILPEAARSPGSKLNDSCMSSQEEIFSNERPSSGR